MSEAVYDVVVIGAGVTGCAVARELSRLDARVCVVEREEDVCCGTSKANSAIVHAGFDAATGSMMAKLNVEGNALMWKLADDLDILARQCGSLVVCTDEDERGGIETLLERGRANGVPDLRVVEREELKEMEPNISDAAVCALWAPTAGIIDPFELTIALAENAATNGVEFIFDDPVEDIWRGEEGLWHLRCAQGELTCRCVVNAAGVYADVMHNLVSDDKIKIIFRKGEYLLLDTAAAGHVRHTVFTLPTKMGKGILVSPTVHGNVLLGPTARDVDDPEATDTTDAGLAEVRAKCSIAVKDVPLWETITSFAGLRAHEERHEFIIGEVKDAPAFIDCAAIESPGLTSSPAIGRMAAGIVADVLGLEEKPEGAFVAKRKGIERLEGRPLEEWAALCERDPAFGKVVCRCRHVSEAQVVAAIHRPLGARSVDGVKRRVTCGMGRCQGGFCMPKVMEILERELGCTPQELTKSGAGSELVVGVRYAETDAGKAGC